MTNIPTMSAEPLLHFKNFVVTNSLFTTSLLVLGFVLFGYMFKQKFAKADPDRPKGLPNFVESIVESLLEFMDRVTNSRERSIRFLPLVGGVFIFILVSNWLGLLPGIGSIGIWETHEGVRQLVPFFRPPNTDLNMTLSLAVLSVVVSHLLGVGAIGFFRYANKYIKVHDLWLALKSLSPMKMIVAFIEFGVGLIEIVSEVAKFISLSLRLFGNIFAGEVLLTVIAGMFAFFLPLPFMGLELLVGVVQATVFAMLTLVYMVMATEPLVSHEEQAAH